MWLLAVAVFVAGLGAFALVILCGIDDGWL